MLIPTKHRLRKRLSAYWKVEAYNAFFFTAICFYLNRRHPPTQIFLTTYGLLLMVFILVQGTLYWRLVHRRLRHPAIDHRQRLSRFAFFKRLNVFFLVMALPLLGLHLTTGGRFTGWALAANGFALLEHINYYHVQLMYDNPYDWRWLRRHKRLKTAALKKALMPFSSANAR